MPLHNRLSILLFFLFFSNETLPAQPVEFEKSNTFFYASQRNNLPCIKISNTEKADTVLTFNLKLDKNEFLRLPYDTLILSAASDTSICLFTLIVWSKVKNPTTVNLHVFINDGLVASHAITISNDNISPVRFHRKETILPNNHKTGTYSIPFSAVGGDQGLNLEFSTLYDDQSFFNIGNRNVIIEKNTETTDSILIHYNIDWMNVIDTKRVILQVRNGNNIINYHPISIPSQNVDSHTPVLFSIGGTFDFFDNSGLQLYGDFNLAYPKLFSYSPFDSLYLISRLANQSILFNYTNRILKGINIHGFYAGFSQSKIKLISTESPTFIQHTLPHLSADSVRLVSRVQSGVVENERITWTFYLKPMLGTLVEEGTNAIHWGLSFEGMYHYTTINPIHSILQSDTIILARHAIGDISDSSILKKNTVTFQGFLGVTAPISLKTSNISTNLFPSLGLALSSEQVLGEIGELIPNESGSTKPFFYYNLRYSIMETQMGFTLGGEIRHIIGHSKPMWIVYFSKNFNLARIYDTLSL